LITSGNKVKYFCAAKNIQQENCKPRYKLNKLIGMHWRYIHTCMAAALLMSSWIPRPAHLPTYEQKKDVHLMALSLYLIQLFQVVIT